MGSFQRGRSRRPSGVPVGVEESLGLTISMGPKKAARPTMFLDDAMLMIRAAQEHARNTGVGGDVSPEMEQQVQD